MLPPERMRIGFPVVGDRSWIGGVNYILHLIKAVSSLPAAEKPENYLMFRKCFATSETIALYREVFPHLRGLLYYGPEPELGRLLGSQVHVRPDIESAFDLIDFVFPVIYDAADYPSASWIPDFQHKFMPELFTTGEIAYRDGCFAKIAAHASFAVFSSRSAAKDFRHFYPDSAAVSQVLHFRSLPEEKWFDENPRSVCAKYGLPSQFIMCCNQFWAHKDHHTLFSALARMKAQGHPVSLVCTGPTVDHRQKATAYFAELQQTVEELQISDQVRILGLIDRFEQIQLLRASRAVVQPSLFEGWSSVVEDCRALGKCIFLSDIEVHCEQQPQPAFFFRAGDAADLAGLLARELPGLTPSLCHQLEEKALKGLADEREKLGRAIVRLAKEGIGIHTRTKGQSPTAASPS